MTTTYMIFQACAFFCLFLLGYILGRKRLPVHLRKKAQQYLADTEALRVLVEKERAVLRDRIVELEGRLAGRRP